MRTTLTTLLAAFISIFAIPGDAMATVPVATVEVVQTYPHDPDAFTQGLVIFDGELYEGTGRNGQSSLRRVALDTGEVLQRRNLGSMYFGEGITIMNGRVYQLTWQSQLGFVYDRASFDLQKTFFLPGEGWGITHDGTHLIVSDGTAQLRFLDPETQKEVKRITVTEDGLPLNRLNELEFIDGEVWANVWYTDYIVRIDPQTGRINSKVDLGGLHPTRGADDVLNGIAWDAEAQRLFVTGKLWSALYEVKIVEPAE
ncbi:MAG: glutaminyl-peptide cyclotransferase [Gammaproteobacteria bacterium]